MRNYLETLIEEKGLDLHGTIIEVEGEEWGLNIIELGAVVDYIVASGPTNQAKIKETLVKIDVMNGDIMHFFKFLAKCMAI